MAQGVKFTITITEIGHSSSTSRMHEYLDNLLLWTQVYIDSSLSWNKHINYIVGTEGKWLYFLKILNY